MTVPEEFSRFPDHWDVLPFCKAVKDATSGNTKVQKGDYLESGSIPVVDQGQSLYGGYTNEQSAICKSELPTIVFGDHTRAFKFIEERFVLGADGAKVLEPLAKLDKRFLFHYLKQLRIESAGYSRHFKFLKETYVPVPPLSEQKRIAAILDKADALRRKRQQAIDLADKFLRSVFLDMFGDPVTNPKGWPTKPLSQMASVVTGYPFKSADYVDESAESVRLCRGANVLPGTLDWKDARFWPQEHLVGLEEYLIEQDDIVLAMDRPWISSGLKVCSVDVIEVPIYLVQRVARIRARNQAMQDLIYASIDSVAFARHCCPTETTIPHISPVELKAYPIFEVPSSLLECFSQVSRTTKRKIKLFEHAERESAELFASLSQKAFSGQL
ncbi:restriction endonuclease subunit S [Aeromonas hydrophila]|uniref:restriction endonuclease subunit S n=1 Tax=Aeromonas hydrophila TaxID=644 RepID=UPI001C5BD5EB|nr:restriction endonuclease subunit S [Aeromonas hydrophila]